MRSGREVCAPKRRMWKLRGQSLETRQRNPSPKQQQRRACNDASPLLPVCAAVDLMPADVSLSVLKGLPSLTHLIVEYKVSYLPSPGWVYREWL